MPSRRKMRDEEHQRLLAEEDSRTATTDDSISERQQHSHSRIISIASSVSTDAEESESSSSFGAQNNIVDGKNLAHAPSKKTVVTASSYSTPPATATESSNSDAAARRRKHTCVLGTVSAAVMVMFTVPPPEALIKEGRRTWNSTPTQAWRLLILFLLTVVGCALEPYPMSTVCLSMVASGVFLGILPMKDDFGSVPCTKPANLTFDENDLGGGIVCEAFASESSWTPFSGFTNDVLWLVVLAFFLSTCIGRSGLGRRIGYHIVARYGTSTLALGYCVAGCEIVFSALIPSNTARGAGVVLPILTSLLREALDSDPSRGTEGRAGTYLILVELVLNNKLSNLCSTASANAALMQQYARDEGVDISFVPWIVAVLPHMTIQAFAVPAILYVLHPPDVTDTTEVRERATKELRGLGRPSPDERVVVIVMVGTIVLWAVHAQVGALSHLNTTVIALASLSVLLLTGVLNLKEDVAGHAGAWNTFLWYGVLITLSGRLKDLGVFSWVSTELTSIMPSTDAYSAYCIGVLLYGLSAYFFASTVARVAAVWPVFYRILVGCGVPGEVAARALIVTTGTGYLTPYSNAVNAPLIGTDYINPKRIVYTCGLVMFALDFVVLISVDVLYWRMQGLWPSEGDGGGGE